MKYALKNNQNNLNLELENKQDSTDVPENWNSTSLGSRTAAIYPVTHDTKHSLLIEEIDKSIPGTDIRQTSESSYSLSKQPFEVRRFKTKEPKELNTVKIDFREPDKCKTKCGRNFAFKAFLSPSKVRTLGVQSNLEMLQLSKLWTH